MKEPDYEFTPNYWNSGTEFETLHLPDDPEVVGQILESMTGQIVAWDPVAQRQAWQYQHAGPWNGGMLATAGDLVFQGSLIGEFAAYDAANGERVWQYPVHTGIAAAPVSYAVNRRTTYRRCRRFRHACTNLWRQAAGSRQLQELQPHSRVQVWRYREPANTCDQRSARVAGTTGKFGQRSHDRTGQGQVLRALRPLSRHGRCPVVAWYRTCGMASHDTFATWDAIVLGGSLRDNGMPSFAPTLSAEESEAVKAFVIEQAGLAYAQQSQAQ